MMRFSRLAVRHGARAHARVFTTLPPSPQNENDGLSPNRRVFNQLLKESKTVPNILSYIRLFSTPGLGYLIYTDQFPAAIVCCFFTGILDWLDGYLARKWNQQTVLGSFIDPLADKVFIGVLIGTLTYKSLFPLPLAVLILGRDIGLLGGSFLYRGLTKPKGAAFFATTGTGVIEVKPTLASRVNTVLQMSLIGFALTKSAGLGFPDQQVFENMCWIVGGTTVLSGLSYLDLKSLRNKP
ncbi:hypothetical protein BASA82_000204 [Batrachochytrium salamandrivorans]|nr:hypothetical protein BASA81_001697 [Batrachochytrium salamandrivorans]KAH9262763.1 hypothetical protein BASA82_000204 [Batrachochytrium salamandrivorans]